LGKNAKISFDQNYVGLQFIAHAAPNLQNANSLILVMIIIFVLSDPQPSHLQKHKKGYGS
jgi:hypothetical protein